ncbi:2-phosphosulfolactate phosphatase [Lacisediminihabitans changchengi]|uniref:Probable 2-phosphosulfolactate phosphatase n=1 Tax=Lacisediminihabitans changchengi TaxID=2787634 RepID=A0A934SN34_9MICO|nr:2-phosphosulfolactate phosphatase [Lacisediminihabitans changchengi]MBK4348431.1 2-phosphosulfolactate phosphatase [Lacisediminihabitans changchengi]
MIFAQTQYQVRFEWGVRGAEAIGHDADALVWVDVLGESTPPAVPSTGSGTVPLVIGGLRNRRAVAEWVLARQGDRGERFMVAVVAAGESWADGSPRFAVEDLLAAGAVIDALADLGIDYCSPEAAAASAAFAGLRNATGHLIGASSSGRALTEGGRRSEIDRAIELDVDSVARESVGRA